MKRIISLFLIIVIVFSFASCNKKETVEVTSSKKVSEQNTTKHVKEETETTEVETTEESTTKAAATESQATTAKVTEQTTAKKEETTVSTTKAVAGPTQSDADALFNRIYSYCMSKDLTWNSSLNKDSEVVGYNTMLCGIDVYTNSDKAYTNACYWIDRYVDDNAIEINVIYSYDGEGYTYYCYYH